jgi:hypothetical protein
VRTLKLQVQITIDGFIADANGEMDWMVRCHNLEIIASKSCNKDMSILFKKNIYVGVQTYVRKNQWAEF